MARAATRKIGKTGRPSSQEAEQIDARLLDVAATLSQLAVLAEEEAQIDARLNGYLAELGLLETGA